MSKNIRTLGGPVPGWQWNEVTPHYNPVSCQYKDKGAKQKGHVYCLACLEIDLVPERSKDFDDIQAGRRQATRTDEEITIELLQVAKNDSNRKWISARKEQVINHLAHCDNVSDAVRRKAKDEHIAVISKAGTQTQAVPYPQHQFHIGSSTTQLSMSVAGTPPPPSNFLSSDLAMSQAQTFYHQHPHLPPGYPVNHIDNSQSHFNNPLPPNPTNVIMDPRIADVRQDEFPRSLSQANTLDPRDSVSQAAGSHPSSVAQSPAPALDYSHHRSKRACPSSAIGVPLPPYPLMQFSKQEQKEFEFSVLDFVATGDLPFNFMQNPQWKKHCRRYNPQASPISRQALSGRILRQRLLTVHQEAKKQAAKNMVTLQLDGWTGRDSQHLIAFMISTSDNVFTVKVNNTTTEWKTADKLLPQIEDVLKVLKEEWKVQVIAVTTDASGEAQKAQKMLLQKYPNLVVPDCFAHQCNLIVGDYLKVDSEIVLVAKLAHNIIFFFRARSSLSGLIKEATKRSTGRTLTFLHPVPTRWSSNYISYDRLLKLRIPLELVILTDSQLPAKDQLIIQGDSENKKKAQEVIRIIRNDKFWEALERVTGHLCLLALATNVTQANFLRPDQVLMTFGWLSANFGRLADSRDQEVRERVLMSLEKRWTNTDQAVFVAATVLNPYIRLMPFNIDPRGPNSESWASIASLGNLFSSLYRRFFGVNPPTTIYEHTKHFFFGTGLYANLDHQCNIVDDAAKGEPLPKSPDPQKVFFNISVPASRTASSDDVAKNIPPLTRLALHLFAICPNSASCERLFSSFGQIKTDRRSLILPEWIVGLAELKLHLRDENMKEMLREQLIKEFKDRDESRNMLQVTNEDDWPSNSESSGDRSSGATSLQNSTALISSTIPPSPTIIEGPYDNYFDDENPATIGFNEIRSNLASLAEEEAQAPVVEFNIMRRDDNNRCAPLVWEKVALATLFDYTISFWDTYSDRSAETQLSGEQTLYDLLDDEAPPSAEGFRNFDFDNILTSSIF